eukprot:Polyplicarium_translucidae@DN1379_c0_g1_i3.p1
MKVLGIIAAPLARAWFDEGHILGTTIAKFTMCPDASAAGCATVKRIDDLLALWEDQYPGMSNLQMAPIWQDHIKCTGDSQICGLKRYDAMRMFDREHWTARPYVAEGQHVNDGGCIDLNKTVYGYYPLAHTGVDWACDRLIKDLKFDPETEYKAAMGTVLSTNLHLRMLLHMYTDMHMPSHNIETFAWPHVDGDWVSIDWKIDSDCLKEHGPVDEMPFVDVHSLWDSVGMTCVKFFPDIDYDALETRAKALMTEYPPSYFGSRLEGDLAGLDAHKVHLDSYSFGLNHTFTEFDFSKGGDPIAGDEKPADCTNPPEESKLYCPSEAYIKSTETLGEEQIVLSGYRLANLLDDIAPFLPDPTSILPPPNVSQGWKQVATGFVAASSLALFFFV